MNIIIAPDSFKESLTALEVAQAIQAGFERVLPMANYCCVPMADGGEGTVQSLVDATAGRLMVSEVTAPLGNKVNAVWGLSGDGKTAMIEMAAASGLPLVPVEQRNPLKTTSFGTGELIKQALDQGAQHIILGIGGSATNDGGVGMLQALGANFTNYSDLAIMGCGENLIHIDRIDLQGLDPRLAQVSIEVACDVDNPLCGERGASAVFAPQKGATPAMVRELDAGLSHFGDKVAEQLGRDIKSIAGSGAAGGMGGGLLLLPNVRLRSGVDIVLNFTQLAEKVATADLVITGEGKMDAQSVFGKTPIGVAKVAKQQGKSVIAIVGSLGEGYEAVYSAGIDAVFPCIRNTNGLADALQNAKANLSSCAENVARLLALKS